MSLHLEGERAGEGAGRKAEAAAAVVFDADGVLVDTGGAWHAARATLFRDHGRDFGPAQIEQTLGTGVSGTAELLSAQLERPGDAATLTQELAALLAEEVASDPPCPLPGAVELLELLGHRLPMAVASNSPRSVLMRTLEAAELDRFFDPQLVIGADDVAQTKPAPDLYLAAIRLLRIKPAATIAVEDSPAGVSAARAAGLHVVGVRSRADVALDADDVVESLRDARLYARLGLCPTRGTIDHGVV